MGDVRLWLDLPREIVQSRRMNTKRVTQEYFDQVLWPGHVEYERRVLERESLNGASLSRLDARLPKQALLTNAAALIVAAVPSCSEPRLNALSSQATVPRLVRPPRRSRSRNGRGAAQQDACARNPTPPAQTLEPD